jgi:hypothetical protein
MTTLAVKWKRAIDAMATDLRIISCVQRLRPPEALRNRPDYASVTELFQEAGVLRGILEKLLD